MTVGGRLHAGADSLACHKRASAPPTNSMGAANDYVSLMPTHEPRIILQDLWAHLQSTRTARYSWSSQQLGTSVREAQDSSVKAEASRRLTRICTAARQLCGALMCRNARSLCIAPLEAKTCLKPRRSKQSENYHRFGLNTLGRRPLALLGTARRGRTSYIIPGQRALGH